MACPDCDLLQRLGDVPEGSRALCPRCGGLLRRNPRNGQERALALTLAAAVLFVVANSFPFLSFEMKGEVTETTLMTGIVDLYQQGKAELSMLVALTILLAPLTQIALLIYMLAPLRLNRMPWALPLAFRLLRHAQPWSMMEVFMIGILVAIPKLMGMASVIPGLALWAFVLLMLVLAGATAAFDPESVWQRREARR
ncbi:MAG TPA: paraquat-inducible protein A [Myxococcota bacterium]|nr:paraquat-inducible protein A [Myxococcota bacterium]